MTLMPILSKANVVLLSLSAMALPLHAQPTSGPLSLVTRTKLLSNSGTGVDGVISGNGRYVVFTSASDKLVPLDTNGTYDVFRKDLQTGDLVRVSALPNVQGNDRSEWPSVSFDGRFIAFQSSATNLVALDTNGKSDIYLRDMNLNTIKRISLAQDQTQPNKHCFNPQISMDGKKVLFETQASNLGFATSGYQHVFVRQVSSPILTLVSSNGAGQPADGRGN